MQILNMLAFISPDEAIMRLMAVPLILSAIGLLVAIPAAIRRRNMAINEPEKYRRLRAWEEEESERHRRAMGRAAGTGMKIAVFIAKIFFKK